MVKLFLDAGHGGKDHGASSGELKEKHLTLDIAKRIRSKLKDTGITVKMSRTKDVYLSLTERTNMANSWNADAFLSIHINSGGGSGFESFIYNGDVSSKTKTLQSNLHANIMKQLNTSNRGKKSENLAVVRQTAMPAVLTENLFIDGDQAKLQKDSILDAIAKGHVDGLLKYFDEKSNDSKSTHNSEGKSSKGDSTIKSIQKWIGTKADGIDGPNTQKALIKKLQSELNKQFSTDLSVDGIWGLKTASAVVNIHNGAKGNLTRVLQSALYLSGYKEVGTPDGIYGEHTKKALGHFQKDNGLSVDYIAGKKTFKALFD